VRRAGSHSVDIFEMLARKIVADELSRAVRSTRIDATPSLLKSCFSFKISVIDSA
jgi:hypothetical protein